MHMSAMPPNDAYRTPTSASKEASGEVSSDERTWALVAHLCPLLGYVIPIPVFNILAPGIVWFLKRETMPFVDDQAKESLNFQITVFLAALVCFVLALVVIGIFLLIALTIYSLIMMVLAAKAAQEGKAYRYPICIRLI
jgi:uncharacterized Tic20 family protein